MCSMGDSSFQRALGFDCRLQAIGTTLHGPNQALGGVVERTSQLADALQQRSSATSVFGQTAAISSSRLNNRPGCASRVFLVIAHLSYRGSVEAAASFGVAMNSAVDLHRFDMLKALHLPMPANLDAEKSTNEAICSFLRQGIVHGLAYSHPKTEGETKAKPAADGAAVVVVCRANEPNDRSQAL
jgi:hypothetical protein